MGVGVIEARHHRATGQVSYPRLGSHERLHLLFGSDGHYTPAPNGNGLGSRPARIHRVDDDVRQDEIGPLRRG